MVGNESGEKGHGESCLRDLDTWITVNERMPGLSLHIPEHGSGTSDTGVEGVDVLFPTAEQKATRGKLEGA